MADSVRLIAEAQRMLKDDENATVTICCAGGHVYKGKIKSIGDGHLLLALLDKTQELIHPNEIVSINVG